MRRFTMRLHGANRRTLSEKVLARFGFRLCLAVCTIATGWSIPRPARAQSTDHPELRRAVDAYNTGDLELTLAILNGLPFSLPAQDQAFRNLYRGLVHFATGNAVEARAAFARAVQFDPGVQPDPSVHAPSRVTAYTQVRDSLVELWKSQALSAEEAGELEEARRAWTRVTAATPSDTEARERLEAVRRRISEAARRTGDPGEAATPVAAGRQDSVSVAAAKEDSVQARPTVDRENRDTLAARQAAPESTTATIRRFDPGRALALGLAAPGLGHFYTQRPVRGALVLAAAGGAIAAGVFYEKVQQYCLSEPVGDVCPLGDIAFEESERPLLLPAIGAAAAITILGAIDAFAVARGSTRADGTGAAADDGPPARSGFHIEPPAIEADGSRVQLAIVRLRF